MIDDVDPRVLAVGAMLLGAAEAAVRRVAPDDGDAQVVASLLRQAAVILADGNAGTLDIAAVTPRQRWLLAKLLVDPVLVDPASRWVVGAEQLGDVFTDLAVQLTSGAEV